MKKRYLLGIGLLAGAAFFYHQSKSPAENITQTKSQSSSQLEKKKNPSVAVTVIKEKREPASIKTSAPRIYPTAKERSLLGQNIPRESLTIVNKFNENWEDLYKDHFVKNLPKKKLPKNFEIKKLKSVILTENGASNLMEHIMVSFKNPQGHHFSYEALVNSQTGMIHKTWNQTHFERKKPVTFSATGQEFISQ